MSDKRRGLGRGLGALIPTGSGDVVYGEPRPTDVFFRDRDVSRETEDAATDPRLTTSPLHIVRGGGDNSSPSGVGEPSLAVDNARPSGNGATDRDTAGATARDDGLQRVDGAEFAEIPLTSIRPNARQPRTVFDEDDLAELAHSIREIGVLQPIVVRRLPDAAPTDAAPTDATSADASSTHEAFFELVMGERRWRACQQAGLAVVPAIIRSTDDDAMLRDALLENLHRAQLNPIEEAAAYQQLLEDFGCTHEDLAARIGRSRPQITNTIRLLRLPPLVARRVAAGVLSAGHARALLGVEDNAAMERLAQRIVAEGLSVRSVEEIVAVGVDGPAKAARSARAPFARPDFDDVASRLSDRLDTRVSIAMGRRKGKLTVEFASVDDLDRILGVLALSTPAEQGDRKLNE